MFSRGPDVVSFRIYNMAAVEGGDECLTLVEREALLVLRSQTSNN